MIRKCAWCGCEFGRKEPFEDDAVTHGMCEACYRDLFQTRDGFRQSKGRDEAAEKPAAITAKEVEVCR
jgi:hypothetical protein